MSARVVGYIAITLTTELLNLVGNRNASQTFYSYKKAEEGIFFSGTRITEALPPAELYSSNLMHDTSSMEGRASSNPMSGTGITDTS